MIDLQHNQIKQFYVNYALATQTLVGGGTMQLVTEYVRDHLGEDDVYLEVGCYQAWSFSMVCHFAKCECLAVDNVSQDFQENLRYDLPTRELVLRNIDTIGRANGKLLEGDFRERLQTGLEDIKGRVKFYFYDGPHEEQDQIDGVEMAMHLLADEAYILVDDWGSENVKTSTKHLVKTHPEISLVKVFDGPEIESSSIKGRSSSSLQGVRND